jgi:arylsulfatase A-like enzyme
MIRTDRWKYVYNPCSVDELYDLESDPQELRNLAPLLGFKHILRRMKGRLVNRLRETGDSIVAEGSWQSNSYDLLISKREE